MGESTQELVLKASNPQTPLEELQYLAQNYPSLRPLVAENPSTYPALLEWLAEFSNPDIQAALARRQQRTGTLSNHPPTLKSPEQQAGMSPLSKAQKTLGQAGQNPSDPTDSPSDLGIVNADDADPDATDLDDGPATAELNPAELGVTGLGVDHPGINPPDSPPPTSDSSKLRQPAPKKPPDNRATGPNSTKTRPERKSIIATNKTQPTVQVGKANQFKPEIPDVVTRKLKDEADLRNYSAALEPKKSRKKLWISLTILIILVLLLTLGGNLADLLTGGSGKRGWFGPRGVIARVLGDSDLTADRNNNGIPDNEENLDFAEGNDGTNPEAETDNPDEDKLTLDVKSETRQLAPAPTASAANVKPLPDGAYQVAEFSVAEGNISCTIGGSLECVVANFQGDIGQTPGHGIRFTLSEAGAGQPQDIGESTPPASNTVLAAGASAASGNYACTSSGSGLDCWNLQTGAGLRLTSATAEGYQPKSVEG